jgi:hypothetical protein
MEPTTAAVTVLGATSLVKPNEWDRKQCEQTESE